MKTCTGCGEQKPLTEFYTQPWGDGYRARCRQCCNADCKERRDSSPGENARRCKEWSEKNPDKKRASNAAWYRRNEEEVKARSRAWAEANAAIKRANDREYYKKYREFVRALQKAYYQENRPKYRAYGARRKAAKRGATVPWGDPAAITRIYSLAAENELEVDHIVPLQSSLVCGLHWEGNLRLLPAEENRSKGNRWWPDMWEQPAMLSEK